MKRSEINRAIKRSTAVFERHGWTLPPNPKWDVTDFGLGDFENAGLILINLAEEPEYCEKLMYASKGQRTPAHAHKKKKEDIICRSGQLNIQLWQGHPDQASQSEFQVKINGEYSQCKSGDFVQLSSGERITLVPGVYHEFFPESNECIIGEVSTANDDANDNFFVDSSIGRFSEIDEDEEPIVQLVSD